VKCRGWTFHKKGDLNKLQYRKLENVFDELAPNGEATLLAKNLHAMVKEFYGVFEDDKIKHIYSDLPAIPLLPTKTHYFSLVCRTSPFPCCHPFEC
jgi:hypothetical protein